MKSDMFNFLIRKMRTRWTEDTMHDVRFLEALVASKHPGFQQWSVFVKVTIYLNIKIPWTTRFPVFIFKLHLCPTIPLLRGPHCPDLKPWSWGIKIIAGLPLAIFCLHCRMWEILCLYLFRGFPLAGSLLLAMRIQQRFWFQKCCSGTSECVEQIRRAYRGRCGH